MLRKLVCPLLIAVCAMAASSAPAQVDGEMNFTNNSAIDYRLTGVSSPEIYGGTLPANDPALTLTIGKRYRINNTSFNNHPMEIAAHGGAGDVVLLSQSSTAGTLRTDPAIGFVDFGNGSFEFTVTQSLLDAATAGGRTPGYHCRPHLNNMRGRLNLVPPPEPSDDPTVVFAELGELHWVFLELPQFFVPPTPGTDGGLSLTVTPNDNPRFGFWETKRALAPPPAGIYRIAATVEATAPEAGTRQPEFRLRVFTADNSSTQMGISAQAGEAFIRPSVYAYYESDGVTPFRVALDVVAGTADGSGTVKVTALAMEGLEHGSR